MLDNNYTQDAKVYGQEGERYAGFSWQMRSTQTYREADKFDNPTEGFVSDIGQMGGYWQTSESELEGKLPFSAVVEKDYSKDPTRPDIQRLVIARRLRFVILGHRYRTVVTLSNGQKENYPPFTRKSDRPADSKPESHTQIMVAFPNIETPYVIGLRGSGRSLYWNYDGKRDYGRDIGIGAKFLIEKALNEKYASWKDKGYKGGKPSWMHTSWIDFVPRLKEDNTPYLRSVQQSFYSQFTVDMSEHNNDDGKLSIETRKMGDRFVGPDLYHYFSQMRVDHALPWEQEWKDIINPFLSGQPTTQAYDPNPQPIKQPMQSFDAGGGGSYDDGVNPPVQLDGNDPLPF